MEFTQNDQFLRGLGLSPYATINAVTPNVSGLANPDAMRALHDAGIQQVVSDTSYPAENNPSPNAGIWNAVEPSVLEIPRKPSDLYFNVSQPAEWTPEYAALHTIAAIDYPTLTGKISDDLFSYMLNGSNDPWMFHQANLRNYDGAGHSLLSDVLDAAFRKYEAVMTLPIVSPTMDDLATRVKNRMSLDASGVVATIAGSSLSVTVAHAATVPITGLCVSGGESYAGQSISYVALADGQTATYALGHCGGASGTGGTMGSDPGAGGTSGTPSATGAGGSSGASGGAASGDAGPDAGETHAGSALAGTTTGSTGISSQLGGCGCGLAAGAAGSGALPLALLGAVLAVRRRRRHA
jgi:MYXO-CTERM domain-containing protein